MSATNAPQFQMPCFDHLGAYTSHTVEGSQAALRKHVSKTSTPLNFNFFSYVSLVQCRVLYSFVGFRECPSIDVHEVRAPVYLIPEVKARLHQSLLESNYALRILLISSPGDLESLYFRRWLQNFSTSSSHLPS